MTLSPPDEPHILEELVTFRHDPLGFVTFSFPWGEAGGELAEAAGPEAWQAELLRTLGEALRSGEATGAALGRVIRLAVASGHGIGKSAFVCWLILWAIATHEDTIGVITANTEKQLRTKTWAQLAKWHRLFIGREAFEYSATKLCSRDPEHRDTWRIDAIPWSEHNSEAFAGLHNKGKRILLLFDEASKINDLIWETAEGALTDADTEIIWGVFGNPTSNVGRFRECFRQYRHRWVTREIDARSVSITNHALHAEWINDYGLDSDFVKVRVLGQFPSAAEGQFIPTDLVTEAQTRAVVTLDWEPLILGVDVARQGKDSSVLCFRRGRDARSIQWVTLRIPDLMMLAERVTAEVNTHGVDAVFVDAGGMGFGVVDALRRLGTDCFAVQFQEKPVGPAVGPEARYANRRAEMYGATKRWLDHGALPPSRELAEELCAIEYSYNKSEALLLSPKDEIRDAIGRSPDAADALALTFALPIGPSLRHRFAAQPIHQIDYDPMESIHA